MEFYAKSFAIKLNIFNLIPVNRMATIMTKMKVKLYHDGENIYKHSERHPFLQCLYIGTGAVYTKHGKEVCPLTSLASARRKSYLNNNVF